jgi:hypothetical protein
LTIVKRVRRCGFSFELDLSAPAGWLRRERKKRSTHMRLAGLIWIMLGTTLAGIALTVIVTVPELAEQATMLIPAAAIGSAVLAIPLAIMIAKRIRAQSRA